MAALVVACCRSPELGLCLFPEHQHQRTQLSLKRRRLLQRLLDYVLATRFPGSPAPCSSRLKHFVNRVSCQQNKD